MVSMVSAKAARNSKVCDACHRRKIRCDGEEGNPEPCTYCVRNGFDCHFTYRPNKWPPSKTYVDSDGLERRVDYLEQRLDSLKQQVATLRQSGGSMSGYLTSDSDEFDPVSPPKDEDEDAAESLQDMSERYEGFYIFPSTGMKCLIFIG